MMLEVYVSFLQDGSFFFNDFRVKVLYNRIFWCEIYVLFRNKKDFRE